ncbi:alpha 1,2 mannosyltransferase [Xylographa opegraphella]|nr:alpha 1,2 mannosyltransferase [Xylographa opegraphella]
MWTRIYLLFGLVRLYFALSPSYIHPDENFQGPEVVAGESIARSYLFSTCFDSATDFCMRPTYEREVCELIESVLNLCSRMHKNQLTQCLAGRIFSFPHHSTWEFSPSAPTRSAFPLLGVYGLPMILLRWLWTETGNEIVAPKIIYYTLRIVMFILSFVLEDWAIYELVHSPRQRRIAVILVASSYVTWTYQTHTFSNAVETLVVLWTLVLIRRILDNKQRSSVFTAAILGSLVVFGVFNRITFPAFILYPGVLLVPHFFRKPLTLLSLVCSALFTLFLALLTDHYFYTPDLPYASIFSLPPTPLRSLLYNLSPGNLSHHGLHPPYTHFLLNLPLLLGPAFILLINPPYSLHLLPPLFATIILSLIPHQEARFLLPAIPLFLSGTHLPRSRRATRIFVVTWVVFNALIAILMGVYHQGGVVPMQLHLGSLGTTTVTPRLLPNTTVLWWRTYSPPIWLLDGSTLQTVDLMGTPFPQLLSAIVNHTGSCGAEANVASAAGSLRDILVVAPRSSRELDPYRTGLVPGWHWDEAWTAWRHLNLDDMDWGEDGVAWTLGRVVGRRGLTAWRVGRECET